MLDGLFVADIGKHLVEHRHFAAILRGDLQARLRHQRQQAHGLERDGFAARVGAGDDERLEFFAQPQVVGYDGCRIDQRMARAQQTDAAFPVQLGRNRVHFAPQARLGEDGV